MEATPTEIRDEPQSFLSFLRKARAWVGFLAALTFAVGFAWLVLYKIVPHQRASMVLTLSGTFPEWSIDQTNWKRGGETDVRVGRMVETSSNSTNLPLAQLRSLHRVTVLDLSPAFGLHDIHLRLLDGLNVLQTLRINRSTNADEIWGPKITNKGLATIARRQTLTDLSVVDQKAITDAGLAALVALPALESLDLSGTKIGDQGLVHLAKCTSLRVLGLRNTDITDAGLTHLRGLRELQMVDVEGTAVTQAGADLLSPDLPGSIFVGCGTGVAMRPRQEFKEVYR